MGKQNEKRERRLGWIIRIHNFLFFIVDVVNLWLNIKHYNIVARTSHLAEKPDSFTRFIHLFTRFLTTIATTITIIDNHAAFIMTKTTTCAQNLTKAQKVQKEGWGTRREVSIKRMRAKKEKESFKRTFAHRTINND